MPASLTLENEAESTHQSRPMGCPASEKSDESRTEECNLSHDWEEKDAPCMLDIKATEEEELLRDVLYSVHSLMGRAAAAVWKVGSVGGITDPSSPGEVNIKQVLQLLQNVFQGTQETMDRLQEDARNRPLPEVNLRLVVKEARDLRPKVVKETANPYVVIFVSGNNSSHRTRLERCTLWPKWNQEFTLPISNLQEDYLRLGVWHEHDAGETRQSLTGVRNVWDVSRLIRGTTAHMQNQTSHLLGHAIVNVMDLCERGAERWFQLEKHGVSSKERGRICLAGTLTSNAQLGIKCRQSYDALLDHLVHHQLIVTSRNKEHSECSRPWNGYLTGPGAAALEQYAIMLELTDAAIQLAWWKVGSRVVTADAEWIFSQLQAVQTAMSKKLYQEEEILELQSSFTCFVRSHTERLKDLHEAFPPSSGAIAPRQLLYTLKALRYMQNHTATRTLLDLEGLPRLSEIVTSSLAAHTKNWWTNVTDELRGATTIDEQVCRVINILRESHAFLSVAANTYNAIFKEEMNIHYMQTTYLMVTKNVSTCVRPLVMNICSRMAALRDQDNEEIEGCEYHLEVGTSLWELHMNVDRLHELGKSLPASARLESGVREYRSWFLPGILLWLKLPPCRARRLIKKAVELDKLEIQDDYCDFSSSASETLDIFLAIKVWWLKLTWPDPVISAVVLTKFLDDICSCVISYSDLIREKVEQIFHAQNRTHAAITKQVCVGLNNIEHLRAQMDKMPTQFGFQDIFQKIRAADNGDSAAAQLDATVNRIILNAADNMKTKIDELIDSVLEKMHSTLEQAVKKACKAYSSLPLLAEVLDPSLEVMLNHLNTSNFQRFLWRMWEVVVKIFTSIVMRNKERKKANYFVGVHSIVEDTLKCFSPPDGKGLDEHTATTEVYKSLMEMLETLKMTPESLIAQYYQERYAEQMKEILPCKARLYVTVLFKKPRKLIVEVIMAKDMVLERETTSMTCLPGHQPADCYVEVELVPREWFPASAVRRTEIERKQDPAVYEETFEYDLSTGDGGVREGFLLLTLKNYNRVSTNTFIGEAVVPFSSLLCVDASQEHAGPICLAMTSPNLDIGYTSLQALQSRAGDKVASSFIKYQSTLSI